MSIFPPCYKLLFHLDKDVVNKSGRTSQSTIQHIGRYWSKKLWNWY